MTLSFLDLPGLRKLLTVEPSFGSAMKSLALGLGLDADSILGVMSLESGLNPQATNPTSKATGLIQWMPTTAKALGTSVDALKSMSGVQQLDYVKRYFAPYLQKIRESEPGDYYMAVFMPAFIGAPRETVLGEKGSQELLKGTGATKGKIYEQNAGLDVNKDGRITVGDVMTKNEQRVAAARAKPPLEVAEVPLAEPQPSAPEPPSLSQPWRSSGGRFDLPVLRIGAKGTSVTLVQQLINNLHRVDKLTVNGVYTDAMALEVRDFQKFRGLEDDAVIGPNTWKALCT